MVKFCSGIVKLNPSYFAFLSGAMISISTNLLTNLVFSRLSAQLEMPAWGASGAFLIASIGWAALAMHTEEPHHHWVVHWRDTKEHYDLKEKEVVDGAIKDKLPYLITELILGSTFSVIGIVLLICSTLI